MKVVALVSGGKDGSYAMMKCIQYGHQIVALANLRPADDLVDELDSYMYQTVGHQIIVSYAECMGVPLFRRKIQGSARHSNLEYSTTPGDEVEDMFILLNEVKNQIPSVTAVSSGAISSDYQRLRVESVCSRLGLVSLAYLWKQDQSTLLHEMITNGVMAITVKVAAMGLDPAKHLGKGLDSLTSHLHKLKELYGINVCGEGGEYETLTFDCPLFVNARIVLDKFEVILHSSDSIAPVGLIHPSAFHLENKAKTASSRVTDETNSLCREKPVFVFDVHGDCIKRSKNSYNCTFETTDLVEVQHGLCFSKTKQNNTFSISCWLQNLGKTSTDLHEDLKVVMKHIELQLSAYGFGWEHALYINLYLADMNEFTKANEIYARCIMIENCPFGVPSRSTIELPLLQVGLGRAYMEVLVANDQNKKVLHVQSISCWAPCCIGPYSQASLFKEVLHMAGQLGLDPPTMSICSGGAVAELQQALENSEAGAKCFDCSISTSVVLYTIYCSKHIPLQQRPKIHDELVSFLKQLKRVELGEMSMVLDPIFLYVLVPDLPKCALVEVKPLLFVSKDRVTEIATVHSLSSTKLPNSCGFQQAQWLDCCIQKCVVHGKICAIVLSVTNEVAAKICSQDVGGNEKDGGGQISFTNVHMERVSRFCINLLHNMVVHNGFSWNDTVILRFYFPVSLNTTMEMLSVMFTSSFNKHCDSYGRIKVGTEPMFNIVPVLGAGASSASMDDIITCELFAQKS